MSSSLTSPSTAIKRFFWRYHLILFIIVAAIGTGLAIYSLIGIANKSSGATGGTQASQASAFDQATIQRVRQLSNSPNYSVTLPSNQRNNPFTE